MKINSDALRAIHLAQKLREDFVAGDYVQTEELHKIFAAHGLTFTYDQNVSRYCVNKTETGVMVRIPRRTGGNQDRLYLSQILGAWVIYGRAESKPFEGIDEQSCRTVAAFAAEFLMPRDRFVKCVEYFGHDIERIAKHFGVSKAAARVRIAALRIKTPQMPEQARREAWRCIRWLVAVWVLILVVGTWAAIEIFG